MTTEVKHTLKIGHGNLNIRAVLNKKMRQAVLFIEFKTSQKKLLAALLQKYVQEKCLTTGISMNNGIISAIPGETSIVLVVPDNKITNNIVLLRAYLGKTKISTQAQKVCESGDYSKLAKDLGSFDVIVTGACRTFIAALEDNKPKISRMTEQLAAIEDKQRENFTHPKQEVCPCSPKELEFSGNATAQLYLSICLGDIPAVVTNTSVKFLSPDGANRFRNRMLYKDTFQGLVKNFLTQTGAVGSPAANDAGGKKYKEKCATILLCQQTLSEIYSKLRGFEYRFIRVEQLKSVDSDAMASVKSIKFPKC